MKYGVLYGMIIFLAIGWVVTGKQIVEKPREFNQLVEDAVRYESEKIYVRAIETYKEALKYNPKSIELETRIARNYLALGDESSFANRCNAINEEYRYPLAVVTMLSDHYIATNRNDKAIKVIQEAMKYHKNSEEIIERYNALKYTYKELYIRYENMYPFRNDSTIVIEAGKYGLINKSGKNIVKAQNDWMGALSSDRTVIPICKEGEFFYANDNGHRIEVPKAGQSVEALGVVCNGVAFAKINGAYGYINQKFEELSPFQWENATTIQNGFGAVCQNGKWALIDDKYVLQTDYIYDDVKIDAYGYCSIAGRAFVKSEEGYHMVNENGDLIGEVRYEDAKPFQGEEATAVMINGKWGFTMPDGTLMIEPQYEDAGGFSDGLAPVKTLSGWGYVNQNNQMVIPDDFTEAHPFYKGVAPVKIGNSWTLIELNIK